MFATQTQQSGHRHIGLPAVSNTTDPTVAWMTKIGPLEAEKNLGGRPAAQPSSGGYAAALRRIADGCNA